MATTIRVVRTMPKAIVEKFRMIDKRSAEWLFEKEFEMKDAATLAGQIFFACQDRSAAVKEAYAWLDAHANVYNMLSQPSNPAALQWLIDEEYIVMEDAPQNNLAVLVNVYKKDNKPQIFFITQRLLNIFRESCEGP